MLNEAPEIPDRKFEQAQKRLADNDFNNLQKSNLTSESNQRKVSAARRRLREFQEKVRREKSKTDDKGSAKVLPTKTESPPNTDNNSATSSEKQTSEATEILRNDSPASGNSNCTDLHYGGDGSSSVNPRLLEEESRGDPETVTGKEIPNHDEFLESAASTEQIENMTKTMLEQNLPLPHSPSVSIESLENETKNTTSQKERLLEMASAVANAISETPESPPMVVVESEQDYKNQFLSACLQEQQQLINELHVQVSQYSSRVSELETILATRDGEFEAKLLREVNPLKDQLRVHAQTTGILVAEKAELSSAIEECRAAAQRKTAELEELNDRLKSAQSRITELERELGHARSIVDDTRKSYQQLHVDYANLEKNHNEVRKSIEDIELEASELRQELSLRNAQNSSLQRELEEKNTLLSLNDLKIQQLSSTPQEMQALENQHQAMMVLEQQLSQTREALKSVSREKDEAATQYENYVRQLDSRYENTFRELEESKKRIRALEDQEKSYVQRLSDLEQTVQRERDQVEKLSALQDHEAQIEHLTKSLDALSLEHANLQTTLNERDTEIEMLRASLEEAQESREDSVDKQKLVSALESEQLGASRAVSQNQQLKAQLDEMHNAFVTLSNSKLDLTEQLQAERTIGKKLNARLNEVEEQFDQLKKQLKEKETAIEEMEQEKFQTAQIADQMHHYQAQSHQARTLQQELQNSLGCIEILRRENENLSAQLEKLREVRTSDKSLSNGDESLREETDGELRSSNLVYTIQSSGGSMISDPLKKLEVRFKEAMERVAELTDEKQRLEHLVMQLQSETETIGEYVTLYQKQRAILNRKADEREQTFRRYVEQRNHQQEQLHQLKVLVAELIKKQSSSRPDEIDKNSTIIEYENEKQDMPPGEAEVPEDNKSTPIDLNDPTTSKILDLLTEIKDCTDSCILEPNFHPCPWCSGKLITI